MRIRDGAETVCVAWWDAPHALRVHSQLGDRRPLFVGASGKLLLAHAPEDIQEGVLSGKLERFTPNTIVKRTELRRELKKILAEGYSTSCSKKRRHGGGGRPIRDASGSVIASLSMTAPVTRVPRNKLGKYVDIIKFAAARFSASLGYQGG